MKIRPLNDRVVVRRDDSEDITEGGIVLPDSAQEKPQKGTVIAVGPGSLNDDGTRAELAVSKGDTVLFGKYSGTEIQIDGEEFNVMRESDILAKFK